MLTRLRTKFGTAGLILSIAAMALALTGGALAASGALTSKQKKEVTKIAKQYAGKPGAPGPAGPTGSAGKDGANGKDGSNGINGENGVSGEAGKSVKLGNASSGECGSGGVTVEVEGSGTKKKVCNGQTGFTQVLPEEQTETGVVAWGLTENVTYAPITFAIPLENPLGADEVHVINAAGKELFFNTETEQAEEVTPTKCLGNVDAPTAEPGHLCVYLSSSAPFNAGETASQFILALSKPHIPVLGAGSSVAGAQLVVKPDVPGPIQGAATFAVTAP
jgi:hypothetical protein